MVTCALLCCAGLNGCKQLQQLHISDCGLAHLSRCRVLQQLTELRLHGNDIGWPILDVVAVAMPRLVILDISDSDICYSESRQAFAARLFVRPSALGLQPNFLQPYLCSHTQSFATTRFMQIMSACIPQDCARQADRCPAPLRQLAAPVVRGRRRTVQGEGRRPHGGAARCPARVLAPDRRTKQPI